MSVRRKSRIIHEQPSNSHRNNRSSSGSKTNLYNIVTKYGEADKRKAKQVFRRVNQFEDVYQKGGTNNNLQIDARKKNEHKEKIEGFNAKTIVPIKQDNSQSKYLSQKSIPILTPDKQPK